MKRVLFALFVLLSALTGMAQADNNAKRVHRIVFQLSTDDTLAQKALMKQLNNITTVAPGTKIEVVCHGPGLGMLITGKTIVQEKIRQMKDKGVDFVACEFSMSERKVTKEQIIPEAGFVKAGIIEIVTRQEEGWSYIKSGF
ncbi:MAG: DsrE family protein [Chitinophagaceae bacterium]|nr:DsrE family protein [Chitinophagaceae bacterium]MBL0055549.1 DsrE family protein [Chitinophagaceae bacterium]